MKHKNLFKQSRVVIRQETGITRSFKHLVPPGKSLLITSKSFYKSSQVKHIQSQLEINDIDIFSGVTPNPSLRLIAEMSQEYRGRNYESIIALGGGSVIDFSKVLSFTLHEDNHVNLKDHFYKTPQLDFQSKLFLAAIPTTSGTGSEVTPFSTVWDTDNNQKLSLYHENACPNIALLDANNTITLNTQNTLFPGLDTISHALESIWNVNASVQSYELAINCLEYVNRSFLMVIKEPSDITHRFNMQTASALAGMAISETKTALAHSISYPITLKFQVPHGLACSFTLLEILKMIDKSNVFLKKDIATIDTLQDILELLNLKKEIGMFCTPVEILTLTNQMSHPDRVKNFILDINEAEISNLITNSLS